jgi:hypothetical protein
MERFPRGSMPPSGFAAVATLAPTAVAKIGTGVELPDEPIKECDLSTTCPNCNAQMQPEHAHYRCGACGYRDSCCF